MEEQSKCIGAIGSKMSAKEFDAANFTAVNVEETTHPALVTG